MGRKKAVVEASQSRPTTAKSGTSSLGGRIRHNGGIQPQAQSPQALFHTLASEAEGLARREYFVEAIDVFTNALSIPGFEHDKVCLAGRSRCYLLCGNPKLALNDADECMKIDSTFVRGVYQKAESLYDLGEFETALIFYHRGNRLRPDSDDFKMGIQKSTKGIQAAVSKLNVKKWKELQKLINRNTSSMNSATNKNAGATNANRERKLVRTSDRRMDVPALNFDADLEREMLEELYEDRVFLQKLAKDKVFMSAAGGEIGNIVSQGNGYLSSRVDFWFARRTNVSHKKKKVVKKAPPRLPSRAWDSEKVGL